MKKAKIFLIDLNPAANVGCKLRRILESCPDLGVYFQEASSNGRVTDFRGDELPMPGLASLDAPWILHHVDCVSGRLILEGIGTIFPWPNFVQVSAGGMWLKPAVRHPGLR